MEMIQIHQILFPSESSMILNLGRAGPGRVHWASMCPGPVWPFFPFPPWGRLWWRRQQLKSLSINFRLFSVSIQTLKLSGLKLIFGWTLERWPVHQHACVSERACVNVHALNQRWQTGWLNSLCWPSALRHPGKLKEQTQLISRRGWDFWLLLVCISSSGAPQTSTPAGNSSWGQTFDQEARSFSDRRFCGSVLTDPCFGWVYKGNTVPEDRHNKRWFISRDPEDVRRIHRQTETEV